MSIVEKYRSRRDQAREIEERAAQERKREQEAEARAAEREGVRIVSSEGVHNPTDEVKCPKCGASNPNYAYLCWSCNATLQGAQE